MTSRTLPTATLAETLGVLAGVVGPAVVRGPILRRRTAAGLSARLGLERRAVRRMQRLRRRYAPGPLLLAIPGPRRALILDPGHVRPFGRPGSSTVLPEPTKAAMHAKQAEPGSGGKGGKKK